MTEAQFQTRFTAWLREKGKESAAYELKVAKNVSLPFSRIEEHQLTALWRARSGLLSYKIPDIGPGYKPFDCFSLHTTNAYVVVLFGRNGENTKEFWRVPIERIETLMKLGMKSLKEKDLIQTLKPDIL